MIVLVPTLAACGFDVQTNQPYQAAAGVDSSNAPESGVVVRNAAIVIDKVGDTTGYFIGSFVNGTVANATASPAPEATGKTITVTGISVAGTDAPGFTAIPLTTEHAYTPQAFGAEGDQPIEVPVPASTTDGGYVTVVISFTGQSPITMSVPVFLASTQHGLFASYVPSPSAPETPAATETTTAHE